MVSRLRLPWNADNRALSPVASVLEWPTICPMSWPAVSVVVPSYNGAEHLPTLLASLSELDYPREQLETIVVDDASTDGGVAAVAPRHPQVRFLRNETNRGTSHSTNRGAGEARGEYLFFLNDDIRVDAGALKPLVETMASDPACRVVGARMLNWEGTGILFNGAYLNLEGKGFEEGAATDAPEADRCRREQLFACGGAMLVHRETFLALGGFDEDYPMTYEDVDFGWRANLAGYAVRFEPRAVVHHKLHGFLDTLKYEQKAVNYERNSLWTLYKNLDEANLHRLLSAALLLAAWRTQHFGDRARAEVEAQLPAHKKKALEWIEARLPRRLALVGRAGDSHLRGLVRFCDDLPALRAKRERVQALRRVADERVLREELFPDPYRIWAYNEDHYRYLREAGYERVWLSVIELFDLPALFAGRPVPHLLRAEM